MRRKIGQVSTPQVMNSHQRISNSIKGIQPDTTPIMLHNFMMAAAEAGFTQAQYRSVPENIAQTFIQSIETYGYDGILVDLDTVTLADAIGIPVDFPENEPARSHKGILDDICDVSTLKPVNLENHPRGMILLEAVSLLKEHFKDEVYVRGNCDQAPFSLACCIPALPKNG